ncbi:MAG: GGDEF domain-containing protein [Chloroflexi bacterium]|nr:GGDEF domain-containing protein [Chloroflexota bacterium]MDA8188356.1 GGDEF domain-containing protein [Dehalococcoidales bacterium]
MEARSENNTSNEKQDALVPLLVSLLALWGIAAAGVFAQMDVADIALLGWAMTGVVIAASLARPFRGAGIVTSVLAAAIFFGIQVYRTFSAVDAGLVANYYPLAFAGALCFIVTGLLGEAVSRRLEKMEARLAHNATVIQELTLRDGLTGTLKSVYAERMLSEELERSRRYNHPMSIILFSTDDWQTIVKDRGSDEAAETLKMIGQALTQNLRNMDTVSRYQESRFLALLPETRLAGAQTTATRLCKTVAERASIQLRAGVAEFPSDAVSKHELIGEAEAALKFARSASVTVASRSLLA